MKHKKICLLSTFFALLTTSTALIADQTSDLSVFQPTKDVLANIYMDNNQLIIKTEQEDNADDTDLVAPLALIKDDYITLYPHQLYMLNDSDNDGMIEISALKSVNASLNEFCYSVYNYNLSTQLYENSTALISCKKGDLSIMHEQQNIANADSTKL